VNLTALSIRALLFKHRGNFNFVFTFKFMYVIHRFTEIEIKCVDTCVQQVKSFFFFFLVTFTGSDV
jgi:hypothetical protein